MIPTILVLGLVAGVVLPPRWVWWAVPALGVAWALVLVVVTAQGLSGVPGGFLFGAVNALVAVAVGAGLRMAAKRLA